MSDQEVPCLMNKRLKSVHLVEAVDFVWLADGSRHLGVCVQIIIIIFNYY